MSGDERHLRVAIVDAARSMRAKNLVTSTVGNVSARVYQGMIITPTRCDPEDLEPGDLISLGLDGAGRERDKASLEWRMHAAVYLARPDVDAIAHTHSPFAIARSFDPAPLIVETEERTYLGLDRIEVAAQGAAGTGQLARHVVAALGSRRAALLARHGVVGTGHDPRDAVEMCQTVEHQAVIDWLRSTRELRVGERVLQR